MAKKRLNPTVAEQRKVHAELLELKRANSGEITLKNEHPLEDAMPKTFFGKLKNNLYHYKVLIIVIIIAIAIGSFAVVDYVNTVKPDIEMVAYSYQRILDEQLDCIADLVAPYCEDINKDEEVKLTDINCSFDKGASLTQMEYTSSTHFQTLIAGDPQAILFVLDEASYKHLLEVNEGNSFIEGDPLRLNSEIYATVKEKTGYDLPKGLMIGYRHIKDSLIEDEEISQKCYKNAKDILKKLKEKYPEDIEEITDKGEVLDES